MATERDSLELHVDLCELRYKQLELRIDQMDERFDKLEAEVKDLKDTTTKGMSEIKNMLQNAKDEKFKIVVTSTATIIVGLLAMLGYVITHLPK